MSRAPPRGGLWGGGGWGVAPVGALPLPPEAEYFTHHLTHHPAYHFTRLHLTLRAHHLTHQLALRLPTLITIACN